MSVQSTVGNPAIGLPGMVSDDGFNDSISRPASEAISFGLYVFLDSGKVSLPNGTGDVASGKGGVAARDEGKPSGGSLHVVGGYEEGDIVRVLRKGRVLVQNTAGTATEGGPVYVVHTTGAFRASSDAGATALPGAIWSRGGGVGILEIDISMGAIGPVGPTGPTGPTGE